MFSVRLFCCVAGVLLMSDTNQAKAAVRQSANLIAAMAENINAMRVASSLIPRVESPLELFSLKKVRVSLWHAQELLKKLRQKTTKHRLATLKTAFAYEIHGFFRPGECNEYKYSECNDISGHVQRAMANMIGLALEELTDEKKKEKIKNRIEGIVTQSGDVEQGASVLQVEDVGIKVQQIL